MNAQKCHFPLLIFKGSVENGWNGSTLSLAFCKALFDLCQGMSFFLHEMREIPLIPFFVAVIFQAMNG
jgi:hypothetical protein